MTDSRPAASAEADAAHAHSPDECGTMTHVGSWHFMDEPCTRTDEYRCRFEPRREPLSEHEPWCWRRHTGDCVDGPSEAAIRSTPTPDATDAGSREALRESHDCETCHEYNHSATDCVVVRAALAAPSTPTTEGLDALVAAVRDWVQFGAGDGTYAAEDDAERLLQRIAVRYARLGERP